MRDYHRSVLAPGVIFETLQEGPFKQIVARITSDVESDYRLFMKQQKEATIQRIMQNLSTA